MFKSQFTSDVQMKMVLLMSLLWFPPGRRPCGPEARAHGLVTSKPAVAEGRRPLPVPRSCGTWPGAPPVTAGEAAKQRASEQPVLTNLSLDGACMKMWCFLNGNSANKWRAYDRCGVVFPWPRSQRFLGETLGKISS